ncbi:hypothetical protein AALP_AA1G255600 [Arabis alpina]|uniref:Uncharacterized protein n=1 Tax=Arabis alpina TaxID=50452 RepID=A0A087HQM9_ARAAL|nr:hypothetical protein AALP_AA1G255600 [Arabis alpina]
MVAKRSGLRQHRFGGRRRKITQPRWKRKRKVKADLQCNYDLKREEVNKNLLRTHTTVVSSTMLYALPQVWLA